MARKKTHALLIVESPAKAKTIEKYLGPGYKVLASMGHLIDLPKSRLAIDVDHGFEPEYITVRGKAKILKDLQKQADAAEIVLLASDNDREGEAISFHIQKALQKKSPDMKFERIVFNEITPTAIREAVAHPRPLSIEKVNAQKARRILDRLVGYHISPILWQKVKNGLSAGRVQSVALRLICEREAEVESFVPEEYWTLDVELHKGKGYFVANLAKWDDQKAELASKVDVDRITAALEKADFVVSDVKSTDKLNRPKPPFTTSQLQQTAANRLGFTSRKTMQIAQQLYEGVAMGDDRIGLISYMRTDSVRLSQAAIEDARQWIGKHHPKALPDQPQYYSSGKGAQDAHEAIRPTMTVYTPDYVKPYLNKDQLRLYTIIWERFVSCQMAPSKVRTLSVEIAAGQAVFRAAASQVLDKGHTAVLDLLATKEGTKKLPSISVGEKLERGEFVSEQHFTSGPARYTDATIVKALEEKGIGRPSTYAPIISVLLDRYYVIRKNKQLAPTELGRMINVILLKSFPDVLDVNFTAEMENKLDRVEENQEEWLGMLETFYKPFRHQVDHALETLESIKGVMDEPTEHVCEKCGRQFVRKLGRFGFFLACSGFPDCRNTRSIPLAKCPRPDCGGDIIARKKAKGRGREFFGCTNYPACDFITYFKPSSANCPACGWFLVERSDKKRGSFRACINPDCEKHMAEQEGEDD